MSGEGEQPQNTKAHSAEFIEVLRWILLAEM